MECFFNQLYHLLSSPVKVLDPSQETYTRLTERNSFLTAISSIGINRSMDDYEKRKLAIFNQLNFFQLITGTIVPFTGLFYISKFSTAAWLAACVPPMISIAVILLNVRYKLRAALFCYFIFYPVFTSFIYLNGMNTGSELSFILYGILSVFFLQETGYMLFALNLSLVSYFVLFVVSKKNVYEPEPVTAVVYLANQVLVIGYIFFALYLVKRENADYQSGILTRNKQLLEKNLMIEKQRAEISGKAIALEEQARRLEETNQVKNKLFSIISHDLKAPVFGLRNIFKHVKEKDLSAENIKSLVPDILNDLNNSAVLIENLLLWSKCQMQEDMIRPRSLDVSKLANEAVQLLRPHSEAKAITVDKKTTSPSFVYADKDMISLVLRNLLSNAIKFTPEKGHITISTCESSSFVEIYIRDSGKGISCEQMKKINSNIFYTTHGTNNEDGTGMGLMLCREFISKNGGHLAIESEIGKGSTFSFTLPLA